MLYKPEGKTEPCVLSTPLPALYLRGDVVITKEILREYWAKEKPMLINGKTYRVGKMSYGDYFLEPGKDKGETKPFNAGTIWFNANGEAI